MTTAPNWGRIPEELRQRPQWVIAGPDKMPLRVGLQGQLEAASSTDPATWHDFTTAANAAYAAGMGIGYVLSALDPYSCIDFDIKDRDNEPDEAKWTTEEQRIRMQQLHYMCGSYSEVSTRGKGLHIWLRGKVGRGRKRDGIEIYSQERYIICTGNVINNLSINDGQGLLNELIKSLGGGIEADAKLVELAPTLSDNEVIDKLMSSPDVGPKFIELANGRYQQYGFPSQSEADLALMSYFTFYSPSNDQCRRLFRMTELGKRKKAVKDDRYLNFTLTEIRSRQEREQKATAHGEQMAASLLAKMNAEGQRKLSHPTPLHVAGVADDPVLPPPSDVGLTLALSPPPPVVEEGLQWPPGFAGAIAQFIYNSSPRQVREVAIVAAMGLLGGICGKAYYIPQSGLNMYWVLVARSAIGKEAMHSGISALIHSVQQVCPAIIGFVDFTDFASGPALTKTCATNQSFVNIAGEWGRKLKALAEDGNNAALSSLRTVMTNLYQKSGPQSMVGGITYSNKDSNIASVSGVAFSMIGETTPATFFESLTEDMMADGFLSRFTIVQYEGPRPPLNPSQVLVPDKPLIEALANLGHTSHAYISRNQPQPVGRTDESAKLMRDFEKECDIEINGTKDESRRQMWNRASLKVMRLSATLAVADNCIHPTIQPHHVEWSLHVVRRNIDLMRRSLEQGDVGMGDHTRERKVVTIMLEYLKHGAPAGYRVSKEMQEQGIIPRSLLQTRTSRIAAFMKHRFGATASLDLTIKSLIESGYIMQVDKGKAADLFSFLGACYRILPLAAEYENNAKAVK